MKEEPPAERPDAEATQPAPATDLSNAETMQPAPASVFSDAEATQKAHPQDAPSQKKSWALVVVLSALCVVALGVLLFLLLGGGSKGLYRCYYDEGDGASVEMFLYSDGANAQLAIHRSYKRAFRYSDVARTVSVSKSGNTINYQFQVKADPSSSDPKEQRNQTFSLQLRKGRKLKVVGSDGDFVPYGAMAFAKIGANDTLGTDGAFVHRKAQVVIDPGCWMAYGPVLTVCDDGRTYHYNNGRISSTPVGGRSLAQRTDAYGCTIMEGGYGWNWYYYKYDRDNRLVRSEEREDGKLVTNDYYYNARNQLTSINRGGRRLLIAYDNKGNMKTLSMTDKRTIHTSTYSITATDDWGNPTVATALNNRRSYQVYRSYAYR